MWEFPRSDHAFLSWGARSPFRSSRMCRVAASRASAWSIQRRPFCSSAIPERRPGWPTRGSDVLGNRTTCLLSNMRLSYVPNSVVIGTSQTRRGNAPNKQSLYLKNTGFHGGFNLAVACIAGPSASWGKSKKEWRNLCQQSQHRSYTFNVPSYRTRKRRRTDADQAIQIADARAS